MDLLLLHLSVALAVQLIEGHAVYMYVMHYSYVMPGRVGVRTSQNSPIVDPHFSCKGESCFHLISTPKFSTPTSTKEHIRVSHLHSLHIKLWVPLKFSFMFSICQGHFWSTWPRCPSNPQTLVSSPATLLVHITSVPGKPKAEAFLNPSSRVRK